MCSSSTGRSTTFAMCVLSSPGCGRYPRSSGDAEVVLLALQDVGHLKALQRHERHVRACVRRTTATSLQPVAVDHAGIKPLYVAQTPRGIVFGSQYDQLVAHPWSGGASTDPVGSWFVSSPRFSTCAVYGLHKKYGPARSWVNGCVPASDGTIQSVEGSSCYLTGRCRAGSKGQQMRSMPSIPSLGPRREEAPRIRRTDRRLTFWGYRFAARRCGGILRQRTRYATGSHDRRRSRRHGRNPLTHDGTRKKLGLQSCSGADHKRVTRWHSSTTSLRHAPEPTADYRSIFPMLMVSRLRSSPRQGRACRAMVETGAYIGVIRAASVVRSSKQATSACRRPPGSQRWQPAAVLRQTASATRDVLEVRHSQGRLYQRKHTLMAEADLQAVFPTLPPELSGSSRIRLHWDPDR